MQKCLPRASDRDRFADFHPATVEQYQGRVQVVDAHREVLPVCGWGAALKQVDLLTARIEPGTSSGCGGAVVAAPHAEDAGVEVERPVEIAHHQDTW